MRRVRCVQINLHHSKAASAALSLRLLKTGEDVALIQEPWVNGGKILGLSVKGYRLLYTKSSGNNLKTIRSCILAKSNLNIFILSDFSDEDTVVAAIEAGGSSLWISSCYMSHDHRDLPPPDNVRRMTRAANARNIPIVMGADANAHHHIWGSSDTNERGECIFDYILLDSMYVANRGSKPTFVVANRQEVLDITLVSSRHAYLIHDWRVSDDCSFSDHRYLEFSISFGPSASISYVNRRRTNWERQASILSERLTQPPPMENLGGLEAAVGELADAFKDAIGQSCRPSVRRTSRRPPWWSAELAEARRTSRRLFNEAKRSGNWSLYKASVNRFKNLVRSAKRSSWRSFCSDVEGVSSTCRLRRILARQPTVPGYIQRDDGTWTTSSMESLEVLLETHFPGSLPYEGESATPITLGRTRSPVDLDEDRLRWAIGSFCPFKSAGPDGIIPADLQRNLDLIAPWLLAIFRACLDWSYVPVPWRRCDVIFLPKGGKVSHTRAKDFRPISLTSFLLKTLERIVDIHLRTRIDRRLLSTSQHAYTKGRSVETALHSLVSYIESSLEHGDYTLAAFLDIEGAFNNVGVDAITGALGRLGVDDSTTGLIRCLLVDRVIASGIGDLRVTRRVCRGTPQGGVLSPLLWNVALNTLLGELDSMGVRAVAYADDVAIALSGFHVGTISCRLGTALNRVCRWCTRSGLSVNPSKTELVLFTRKYKVPSFTLPRVGGVDLTLSDCAKFLGVILDRRLRWTENVRARATKAMSALYVCRRAIGTDWGLGPKEVHWLVEAVVGPILFHGALVWWGALGASTNRLMLERVFRVAALMVTGALRTTPTKALLTLLGWLPVDLVARRYALRAAIRLRANGAWRPRLRGHASILEMVDYVPDLLDYCTPRPYFDRKFSVFLSEGYDLPPGALCIYVDGSKGERGVGGGVYIEEYGVRMSFRLPDGCSVLQAEVSAIVRAARWLRFHRVSGRDIWVLTDSKAAIKSLSGVYTTSVLVWEGRLALDAIADFSSITLAWVRAHGTDGGNEVADTLAKEGALLGAAHIDAFTGLPLPFCWGLVDDSLLGQAQRRWTNESTCRMARIGWPRLDMSRTTKLLTFSRAGVRKLVGTITGHCGFGTHAARMGLPHNDFCRSCGDEEEEETIFHLICHCPALETLRLRYLGSARFSSLSELPSMNLDGLLRFVTASGWFRSSVGR